MKIFCKIKREIVAGLSKICLKKTKESYLGKDAGYLFAARKNDKSIEILKNVSQLSSGYDRNYMLAPSENMDELVKLLTSGSLVTE
ncbi:hypothetical protein IID62_10270 [candidate division KSB1 bacterium]|nr:hypothetical protein [candidate division KSB1 bacterium]